MSHQARPEILIFGDMVAGLLTPEDAFKVAARQPETGGLSLYLAHDISQDYGKAASIKRKFTSLLQFVKTLFSTPVLEIWLGHLSGLLKSEPGS
jgi:hypothetical protein